VKSFDANFTTTRTSLICSTFRTIFFSLLSSTFLFLCCFDDIFDVDFFFPPFFSSLTQIGVLPSEDESSNHSFVVIDKQEAVEPAVSVMTTASENEIHNLDIVLTTSQQTWVDTKASSVTKLVEKPATDEKSRTLVALF
jgi:hypothetical protein